MKRREIEARFDDIVEFSGVEKFIDTPVKRYSSGMYVRLAFAVAAHLEPEILFVDEVLSVGDAEFQRRCLGRMEELANTGRTVVFVSHALPSVAQLCDRAIWIDGGQLVGDGDAADMIANYLHQTRKRGTERVWPAESAPGNDLARIRAIRVLPHEGMPPGVVDVRRPLGIEIGFDVLRRRASRVFPKIKVLDREGAIAFNAMDTDERWRAPIGARAARRDRVDPREPPERGRGERRGGDLQPRLPEARAPRRGVRGGLVRGARPRRGRLGAWAVQRPVAGGRPADCSSGRTGRPGDDMSERLCEVGPTVPRGRAPVPNDAVSVVVSTCNWPEALDAVLRGLAAQSDPAFEVVVADDGSTSDTAETVARWTAVLGDRLVHAWQPDEGFRLARVRNLGAAAARGTYLVFVDGDCIPRRHFVAAIRRGCVPGLVPGEHPTAAQREPVAHGAARPRADRDLEHGGPDRPRARRHPRTGPPHAARPPSGPGGPGSPTSLRTATPTGSAPASPAPTSRR